jgi:hypothetical protein
MRSATRSIAVCLTSVALAEDFKTIDGKEYKNVKVSHVEPDGIVVVTKSGVSKTYFVELPKDIQLRFHYDAQKAASYTSEQSEKVAAFERRLLAESQQRAEERKKYWGKRATPTPTQNGDVSDDQSYPSSRNTSREQGPQNCYMEVRNVVSGLEIQRNWETS